MASSSTSDPTSKALRHNIGERRLARPAANALPAARTTTGTWSGDSVLHASAGARQQPLSPRRRRGGACPVARRRTAAHRPAGAPRLGWFPWTAGSLARVASAPSMLDPTRGWRPLNPLEASTAPAAPLLRSLDWAGGPRSGLGELRSGSGVDNSGGCVPP